MSRQRIGIGLILLAGMSVGLTLFLDRRDTSSGSSLSMGARGHFLARRYLEERGLEVGLLDRPLQEAPDAEVLVCIFPWQRWASPTERIGLQQHLLRGGTLLLAYSGESESSRDLAAMEWLGLVLEELRGEPPSGPFDWIAFANEEWSLAPAASAGAPLSVSALSRAPKAPEGAVPLYRGPSGNPLAFMFPQLNGQVVVLPADAFSNARILEGGNADFLESLGRSLGRSWIFDEYHHGLSAPLSEEQKSPRFALDLFLLHVGLLYALVVWRLARPFGRVWPERPLVRGSTKTFLLGLGALHDRLGHHEEAAELIVRRARELQPRLDLEGGATRSRSAKELVTLGAEVAREQSRR